MLKLLLIGGSTHAEGAVPTHIIQLHHLTQNVLATLRSWEIRSHETTVSTNLSISLPVAVFLQPFSINAQRVNVWRIGRASSIWSLTGNSSAIESLRFDPTEEFLVWHVAQSAAVSSPLL